MEVPGAMTAHVSPDGLLAVWKETTTDGQVESALWIGPDGGALARYEPAPVVVKGALYPNVVKFSPDGTRILLWVIGGPSALLVVPVPQSGAAGEPARRVFEGQLDGPPMGAAWMPDSRRIVLSSGGSLWLGDIENDRLTRLTMGTMQAHAPSVSPSGDRLIYTDVQDNFDVVTLPLDGGPPRVVVATSQYEGAPAWTSRGGRLAYVAWRGDGEEIWTRTAEDLSDRRLITAHTMPDPRYRIFKSLAFSPDGQWLAFVGAAVVPELKGRIWIAPAGGGTPRPVTPEGMLALRPSWAPDGRSLVVWLNDRGTHGLWIVGLDAAQQPRRIPLPPGVDARLPEWSPVGEWIAAVERLPAGDGRPTLIIKPETGELRRLPSAGTTALVWSRDGRTLYGVDTQNGTAKLKALDIASGAVRTIADYGVSMRLEENLNWMLRFSLAPDGKAFTTTISRTARICG